MMRRWLLLLLALSARPAFAQAPSVEVGAYVESLSGPYADGRGISTTATWPTPQGWLRLDAAAVDRLGDRAGVLGVAGGRDVGRWVVIGGLGTSTSGLAHPRAQASLGGGRRWGERRQLVTTLVAAVRDARDVHRDFDLAADVALYGSGITIQGGVRMTLSQPGDALGGAAHAAVTVGDPWGRHVMGRLSAGREAYLLTGLAPVDVAFQSGVANVVWHEPVGQEWAITLDAGLYVNPFYTQVRARTGVIRRF